MAQNVTLYNLLISCPGDIKEEVMLIESSVEEFNELYAETLGITIKTRHWSKSSYAQSGGKSQALLNEQFVEMRCGCCNFGQDLVRLRMNMVLELKRK